MDPAQPFLRWLDRHARRQGQPLAQEGRRPDGHAHGRTGRPKIHEIRTESICCMMLRRQKRLSQERQGLELLERVPDRWIESQRCSEPMQMLDDQIEALQSLFGVQGGLLLGGHLVVLVVVLHDGVDGSRSKMGMVFLRKLQPHSSLRLLAPYSIVRRPRMVLLNQFYLRKEHTVQWCDVRTNREDSNVMLLHTCQLLRRQAANALKLSLNLIWKKQLSISHRDPRSSKIADERVKFCGRKMSK